MCFIGAILASGGCFFASFTNNYIVFTVLFGKIIINNYIFLGFTFGIGAGISYMVPWNNAYKYFPNNKGVISGILSAGFGIGAFVMSFLALALMNPNNEKVGEHGATEHIFPKDVSDHLPKTIRVLGIVYFVLTMIGSLLIIRPSEEEIKENS